MIKRRSAKLVPQEEVLKYLIRSVDVCNRRSVSKSRRGVGLAVSYKSYLLANEIVTFGEVFAYTIVLFWKPK